MLRWIVTAVALILTAPMALADLESGLKAYQGENYEAVLGAFKPLAESGDAEPSIVGVCSMTAARVWKRMREPRSTGSARRPRAAI